MPIYLKQMFRFLIVLCSSLFLASPLMADVWDKLQGDEYKDNDVEDYVWKEGRTNIPDYPQDSNLIEVEGPPAYRNYQYLVDEKSIQLGEDYVVRFTVVIRSPAGADNVMYDGVRCSTSEIKNYAYGSTDKKGKKILFPRTGAAWKPIRETGVMGYSKIFAVNYICDFDGFPLKRNAIIQNMKYGKGNVDGLYY